MLPIEAEGSLEENKPVYTIFDLDQYETEAPYSEYGYSDKTYDDFTVSFSDQTNADLRLFWNGDQICFSMDRHSNMEVQDFEMQHFLKKQTDVWFFPYEALKDRGAAARHCRHRNEEN